jgi:tetratricopeptide (TPR) repeat protein
VSASTYIEYLNPQSLPVPDLLHQVRPPLADFTGRQAELEELLAQVDRGVTISGVQGMGGVGKTELAYVLADRLKDRYPDAQLYLDLKGTSAAPLSPADVLAFIIRCFHPGAKLADDPAELQGVCRSVLNGKRVLLLMDNAGGPEQIRPLCPPATGSVMLVTARQHFTLPGLYAKELDTLPADKACELLRTICRRIGETAAEVARLCGYLPLALRLAGSALACSTLDAAELATRLQDERRRLSELDRGAETAGEQAVTASLALSEALLSEPLRQRWYMLGVCPGDFDALGPATVWQAEPNDAQDALDALHRHSVLEWNKETRRFRLHDLVRSFVRDRLAHAAPPNDEPTAVRRLVEHYAAVAARANAVLKQKDSYVAGLALFDAEWLNIQAAYELAADRAGEQPWANEAIVQLAGRCSYCLDLRLHGPAKVGWFATALDAARRAQDREAEGVMLGNLGNAYAVLGDARRAIEFYEQHLAIAREIGDRRGEGNALGNLGLAYADLGDARRAIEFYEQHLAIAREIGDQRGEGNALGNLGLAYADLGDARKAIEFHEQRLAIAREIGDRRGEGATLGNLGLAYAALGDARKAIEFYEGTLATMREIGDRRGGGNALGNLGNAYAVLGDVRKAIELHEQQLVIVREIGDRRGEGNALGNLGNAYAELGDVRKAIEFYGQRLAIAREIGDRRGEGATLGNLGVAYAALGDARRAIEFYEQHLAIAREIGDRRGEGNALGNLGLAYAALGDVRKAVEFHEQQLVIVREIGDRGGEGNALGNLGNACAVLGDARKAVEFYEQQLVVVREIGDRAGEARASWNMGDVYETLGDLARAVELMQVCVDFEREIGHADAEKHAAYVAALRARLK